MRSDPFQFEWPVDQAGYEVWHNPHDEETALLVGRNETIFIQSRGGPLRYYRPLENEALWRRFAETCTSIQGAVTFANEFGLILEWQKELPNAVEDILAAALLLRDIAEHLDAGDRHRAADVFNEGYPPLVTEGIYYNERTGGFEHVLVPATLLSALLHQAAQAISGNHRFRRCRNEACPNWFRLGSHPAGERGRRKTITARREFCSDRCRVASARRHKREVSAHA